MHLYLTLVKVFLNERILSSNIHWNCSVLWFNKAIVCCTGKCSCITPVDVCYSQHLPSCNTTVFPCFTVFSLVQVRCCLVLVDLRLCTLTVSCCLQEQLVYLLFHWYLLELRVIKKSQIKFKDNWMACTHIIKSKLQN